LVLRMRQRGAASGAHAAREQGPQGARGQPASEAAMKKRVEVWTITAPSFWDGSTLVKHGAHLVIFEAISFREALDIARDFGFAGGIVVTWENR